MPIAPSDSGHKQVSSFSLRLCPGTSPIALGRQPVCDRPVRTSADSRSKEKRRRRTGTGWLLSSWSPAGISYSIRCTGPRKRARCRKLSRATRSRAEAGMPQVPGAPNTHRTTPAAYCRRKRTRSRLQGFLLGAWISAGTKVPQGTSGK